MSSAIPKCQIPITKLQSSKDFELFGISVIGIWVIIGLLACLREALSPAKELVRRAGRRWQVLGIWCFIAHHDFLKN
jgi:hypothetical protein